MKAVLVIASLLAASPAFGQTKVYSNKDLGQPVSSTRVNVSPEVLASLAAHQFRLPPRIDGPYMVSSGLSPTAGPFSDYQNTIVPRRLDGSLWSEPQWQMSSMPGFYPYPYVPFTAFPSRPQGGHRSEHRARR